MTTPINPDAEADWKKSSYSYSDLLACAHGKLGGLPPLPAPPLLMFDRINEISEIDGEFGKGFAHAVLEVKPNRCFFDCHFIGDPVMPGCLGLDALWQLAGFFAGWSGGRGKGRALEVGGVKFAGEVSPSARTVVYRVEVKSLLRGRGARPWIVFANGYLECDGALLYTANDLKVGIFPK